MLSEKKNLPWNGDSENVLKWENSEHSLVHVLKSIKDTTLLLQSGGTSKPNDKWPLV